MISGHFSKMVSTRCNSDSLIYMPSRPQKENQSNVFDPVLSRSVVQTKVSVCSSVIVFEVKCPSIMRSPGADSHKLSRILTIRLYEGFSRYGSLIWKVNLCALDNPISARFLANWARCISKKWKDNRNLRKTLQRNTKSPMFNQICFGLESTSCLAFNAILRF